MSWAAIGSIVVTVIKGIFSGEFRKTAEFIRSLFEKNIEDKKQDIDKEVGDENEKIRKGERPDWD